VDEKIVAKNIYESRGIRTLVTWGNCRIKVCGDRLPAVFLKYLDHRGWLKIILVF
jgi:hypothetical protein